MSTAKSKTDKTAAPQGAGKKVEVKVLVLEGIQCSAGVCYAPAKISLAEAEANELAKAGKVKLL